MKPLSFEEWYEKETGVWPYMDDDEHAKIELYAQYRSKLAWDEASKAQRDACADCVAPTNYNFSSVKKRAVSRI